MTIDNLATKKSQASKLSADSAKPTEPNRSIISEHTNFLGILSRCDSMRKVFSLVERVAPSSKTVLITGESGTGKELIAKALHVKSRRVGKLITVNCGAIPENILESELFGHERGAFTGATTNRKGKFQLAHKGTIFLDEIGDMSPKLQVKILRVLQDRKVDPIGSSRSLEVDVRIIAATNKVLNFEVKEGNFREDLYYRLNVIPIYLPPLRERIGDPVLLSKYFMNRECLELGREDILFSDEAERILASYLWPGNIRELENAISKLSIIFDGTTIEAHDLDFLTSRKDISNFISNKLLTEKIPDSGIKLLKVLGDIEEEYIKLALSQTNWDKKQAAKLLSISMKGLVEKIKKRNISK